LIKRYLTKLAVLSVLWTALIPAHASNTLEQDATLFLNTHLSELHPDAAITVSVNPISSRIKLVRCSDPVQFKTTYSGSSRRVSLRAMCSQPRWQIYMTAKVQITKPIIVSRRAIMKGEALSASSFQLQQRDITTLRNNYFSQPSEVVGYAAKRNIPPNSVLTTSMLKQATMIEKGDSVMIEARKGSLSIRMAGTALQKGLKGKQISVRNDKSGRVIKAVVIAPGLVRTP